MNLHKEGHSSLILTGIIILLILSAVQNAAPGLTIWVLILLLAVYGILLNFFRNPDRTLLQPHDLKVFAPADGKVVVIEEAFEDEFLKEKRIQVSIFMSPLNVHVNRFPISGRIAYAKYHPGKYLLAWNPKSSQENERTTLVIENNVTRLLIRQIAGFLARRIICYPEQGDHVKQGGELGFIKLGSRVDLILPLDAEIKVSIGDKVEGNRTIIAELKAPM
jgi:phosphatidylserine decarboxylase